MTPPAVPAPSARPPARDAITGLILAGGRGARMGDLDKGLLPWRGKPLVAHVCDRLAPQVGSLLISANRNLDRYAAYGAVLPDEAALGPWQGPLAGVAAGLAAATTAWLAVAPCDTPRLPSDLVPRLADAVAAGAAPLAVASAGGRRHSVCMLLAVSLLPDLLDYLRGGLRKVDTWQARVGAVEVPFGDDGGFFNINTPDQLADKESPP